MEHKFSTGEGDVNNTILGSMVGKGSNTIDSDINRITKLEYINNEVIMENNDEAYSFQAKDIDNEENIDIENHDEDEEYLNYLIKEEEELIQKIRNQESIGKTLVNDIHVRNFKNQNIMVLIDIQNNELLETM